MQRAYYERAEAQFRLGRYLDSLATTRAGLDELRSARQDAPALDHEQVARIARQWHATARAAHPARVPDQLAAASNALQAYQLLVEVERGEPERAALARDLLHHEVSFNPQHPDPPAEQLLQRAAAAGEALAVLAPIVDSLPDPAFGVADLGWPPECSRS